jgi:signal transduction histidine kinase
MARGLASLVVAAALLVVLSVTIGFVVTLRGFHSVSRETSELQRSEQAVVAASQLETLILDLETGTRGFVLTGDEQFLQPWRAAQRKLPAETATLERVAPGPASTRIATMWRAYLSDWSLPIVRQAQASPDAARLRLAQGAGKRRVDAMRDVLDPLIAAKSREADAARDRVDDAQHRAIVLNAVGATVRILIIVGLAGLFLRAVVGPLRKLALATRRVTAGELGTQVERRGAGEVKELGIAFNEMSRSLERSAAERAQQNVDLERLANVLRAVLDSTVDGIVLTDAAGEVQLANRPVLRLTQELGMRYEGPVVDRLLSIADRVKDPDRYRLAMERLRDNPDDATFDEFEDEASGRVFQGFTAPVVDDRGAFLGRIWTLREVTQQRELDRLKDDFVATVSHELRTPLTSMMGFLEMLREGEAGTLTDEQKRFLAIVYRSSERLQRLVGDLLFVARLDASGLQLQFATVSVDEIVRDCVESSSALARSRELELTADLDDVPPLHGDRERLSQLVSNLLSNAIKFTPAGGRVTARTFVDDVYAVIEVEDTGVGIPVAEQERLFQRFFRSSTATEQAIPGTGLGLVISKAIAEAHGGGVSVRSRVGEGTCFRVRLPIDLDHREG